MLLSFRFQGSSSGVITASVPCCASVPCHALQARVTTSLVEATREPWKKVTDNTSVLTEIKTDS